MKSPISLFKHFGVALFLLLFTVSCLNSGQQEQPDQVLVTFTFNNLNEEVSAGGDSLRILNLRFLVGPSYLIQGQTDSLALNLNTYQVSHRLLEDETKGLNSGTFNSDVVYNIFSFVIKQATGDETNIDPAFVDGDADSERYSMIIEGSYNGTEFTFKSTRNFAFDFPIDELQQESVTSLFYNLSLSTDIRNWFLNSDGSGLLSPSLSSNRSQINDNIASSIQL